MEILKEKTGSKLVVKLVGDLNTATSENLEDTLKSELNDINELIFDFEKLQYISSAGIRVITSVFTTMTEKGNMKIINVEKNGAVYDVFKITNLLDALNVEQS